MNRCRSFAGAILLLAGAQLIPPSVGERAMPFDRVEYTVATMEEAPQVLLVLAGGKATCESHSNMYSLNDPQIGTYQMTLPLDQMEGLARALSQPPFETLPDNWGKVVPAEHYQRIRVVTGSKSEVKLVTGRLPVDPHMQALLDFLDRIAREVKTHPLATLQIEITRAELQNHLLRIGFSLSNTGTQSITIRRPEDLLKAPDGRIEVQVWPDQTDVSANAVKHIEISAVESDQREAAGPMEIQPAASRSYRLVGVIDVDNTNYVARVEYRSLKKEWDGRKLLYGELFSLPAKITVAATGRSR